LKKAGFKPSISSGSNTLAVQPETESDIGRHAKTACGSVKAIRKNDGIKGDEREMPGHETVCGGLYRVDLNGL
jgi:hypothetical protein